MTVSLKHTFQSAKPDGSDEELVQPSNWNEEHELTLEANKLLGRATAGTGAAEEIAIGAALSVSGGTLAVTTVPAANGGTGLTSPGLAGNVLTSDGTGWISQSGTASVSYPQNAQSGNYTLVLSDAGKHIYSTNTGAQTITVPTNASVAFSLGAVITVVNMGTNSIQISGAGVTLYPNGSTTSMAFANIVPGQIIQLIKTATNVWNCTFGSLTNAQFSYLVIAGGGGGSSTSGGGGGAGGYVEGTGTVRAGTLTATVGAGGSVLATGSNSSLTGFTTAIGGGNGSQNGVPAISGGSGGGGGGNGGYNVGGLGTGVQGYKGGDQPQAYYHGGGGGAGEPAPNATAGPSRGGNGIASSITGTSVTRGGGGGAGSIYANPGAAGGAGGGGTGAGTATPGVAGTANTGGGGGGGAGFGGILGAAGGSGVVIISTPIAAASTTGSPTITTSGGNTIYTFTSSGTITW